MNKLKVKLVGGVLGLCIVIMLPCVSLLGENDKSITVLRAYFTNITENKFSENKLLCTPEYNASFSDLSSMITDQFATETALLKAFGVSVDGQYSLSIKKDRIWFPFFGENVLKLSVRVNGLANSNSLAVKYLSFGKGKYLKDFVVMKRVNGFWRIDHFDVQNEYILEDYRKARKLMEEVDYIKYSDDGVQLRQKSFDVKNMDSIEKRILNFHINKMLNVLNEKK